MPGAGGGRARQWGGVLSCCGGRDTARRRVQTLPGDEPTLCLDSAASSQPLMLFYSTLVSPERLENGVDTSVSIQRKRTRKLMWYIGPMADHFS